MDRRSQVIVITSGKGGVGKTTTTANIGVGISTYKNISSSKVLSQKNTKGDYTYPSHKVALIDTDIGLRNLDGVLGLENRVVYDLVDVVDGVCKIKQALIRDKRYKDLYLLPAAQTKDKDAVSPEDMKKLCDELREEFDYIIIDCPAGIEQGFKNAIAAADKAIIVTTPEVSAVRDADRIIGLLEASEIRDISLIINRIRIDMVKKGNMMNIEDILEILAIKLIGIIPDDENIIISTNKGEPVIEDYKSRAGQAYRNIVRRIVDTEEEVPFMNLEEYGGLMNLIKKFFKIKKYREG